MPLVPYVQKKVHYKTPHMSYDVDSTWDLHVPLIYQLIRVKYKNRQRVF